MRSRLFVSLAGTLGLWGIALVTSCDSSLGGGNAAGGSGGGGPAGSGGTATGGTTTGGYGGTAAGGFGGTALGGSGETAAGGSGSGGRGGAGGKAGAPGTGGGSAGGKGGGAAPCGTQTCGGNEVCIHPGCGGGVAICDPLPDGGHCPQGWTESLCPAPYGRVGCMPGPCTPPAPFCAPLPASCGGTPNCTCLPPDVCGVNGGTCGWIQNGAVMCGFA